MAGPGISSSKQHFFFHGNILIILFIYNTNVSLFRHWCNLCTLENILKHKDQINISTHHAKQSLFILTFFFFILFPPFISSFTLFFRLDLHNLGLPLLYSGIHAAWCHSLQDPFIQVVLCLFAQRKLATAFSSWWGCSSSDIFWRIKSAQNVNIFYCAQNFWHLLGLSLGPAGNNLQSEHSTSELASSGQFTTYFDKKM